MVVSDIFQNYLKSSIIWNLRGRISTAPMSNSMNLYIYIYICLWSYEYPSTPFCCKLRNRVNLFETLSLESHAFIHTFTLEGFFSIKNKIQKINLPIFFQFLPFFSFKFMKRKMHKTWYERGECMTENIWLLVLIWFFCLQLYGYWIICARSQHE